MKTMGGLSLDLKVRLGYPKPIIVCSMCLGFSPVRYDGNILFDSRVEKMKKHAEFIPVCPEVGIGLGVPRNPLVLYKENGEVKLVDTVTGKDLSTNMVNFTASFLGSIRRVDGVILKSGSPSCGVGDAKVYGWNRRVRGKADGFFTRLVKQALQVIPIESEKRLEDHDVRRNFYTRVFTIAYVRKTLEEARSNEDIVVLHRSLKYLLMLYSPSELRRLGRVVASRKNFSIEELREIYEKGVLKALSRTPTPGSYISVFQHLYSHLKNELSDNEKKYIVSMLEKYYSGKESLRTLFGYFKGFVYRFTDPYLAEQRFLQPYPEDLDEPV